MRKLVVRIGMVKNEMMNIKEISLIVDLENGSYPLNFDDRKAMNKTQVYSFSHEDMKIKASVTFETEKNVTYSKVAVEVENPPFRECYNLKGETPIHLSLQFEEMPVRMCAQYQHRDWWSRPEFVSSFEEIPERTQSLFLQGNEKFGYILPMVGNKTKTYITKGTKKTLEIEMTAYTAGINKVDDYCFVMSEGNQLYAITEAVFQKACALTKIPMKADRKYPEIFEYFGWCSWDAFYTQITEEKVLQKVEELKSKKVPARWILMDDGWLNTSDNCLTTLEPDPIKFPNAFYEMIHKIKSETEIKWVGVWHAFAGYWGGIAPDTELASKMKNNLYETKNGKLIPHYNPEKGYEFWEQWYTYLQDQGIDFVKVDGQSALKNYYKNNEEIGKVSKGAHATLERAVNAKMNGNIINCMGMAIENILNRPNTSISRNSDDFVPNDENGFREHMLENAYNALYHDHVYVCDWDMYWTKHADAGKHALVRAISGGPIYVSDRIGETIYEEIIPLVYHDGRILRMDRCAKPTMDCIFDSPEKDIALKLTNTVNGTGALAAFHISKSAQTLEVDLSPSDIYDLQGELFGAYCYYDKSFSVLKREEAIHVSLKENEYSLALFIPMQESVTPIGLIDKYMSTHAVKSVVCKEQLTEITLVEGGNFAFHKSVAPTLIKVNGLDRSEQIIQENGFYRLDLSDYKEEVVVTIG